MKISVQSLFEDYEDDTVELRRDADTARILEKTMAKLPNARKKRPLRLVLFAAAAVAVLSLSAVYALWFGTVFTDHMCVSSGAEPMFARQQPDGSWQGVLYRINNGTVLIFGQKGE